MRTWDQASLILWQEKETGLRAMMSQVNEWEWLGSKSGFWGGLCFPSSGCLCLYADLLKQQLAFQGPGTGKAARPKCFCYGKAVSFSTQLFCLGRGSPFTSHIYQDITKEN